LQEKGVRERMGAVIAMPQRRNTKHPSLPCDRISMRLAIILVNWRNEEQTLRCAQAIFGWRKLNPELIVVDNESTEASRRILATVLAPDQVVPSVSNRGYGGGNNLGITRAFERQSDSILLLNSDVEITEEAVAALVSRLEANPRTAILGPAIEERATTGAHIFVGGRDIALHVLTRVAAASGHLQDLPGYPLPAVDYVSGTVFLVRRAVFEAIGLLDEQYFFSGEIADFCQRARLGGYQAAVDLDVMVIHDTRHAVPSQRDTLYAYYSLRNRFLYVRKHHGSTQMKLFAYWASLGASQAVRALLRCHLTRARALALAVAHGCANRYGNQNDKFKLA
jgi:GT2 family glycosyltransferase